MIDEWIYLVRKYTAAGARSKFEEICTTLFKNEFSNEFVKSVKVVVGDGGVDIFVGDIDKKPISVIQCKFFINGINDSQKAQIKSSFNTVIESKEFRTSHWTLCIPDTLSLQEHKWFASWKKAQIDNYSLPDDFIELIDGADLIDGLKKFKLYNDVFDLDFIESIKAIQTSVVAKSDIEEEIRSASRYMRNLKNYFSKIKEAHLHRRECDQITAWVGNDLPGKENNEKILVVKGKRGVGKSTILHDVYHNLTALDDLLVLAIKCDQFYDINLESLASQFFGKLRSFQEMISAVGLTGKKFVVILDQLDALSQTLSTDRRWLQTYIKLIYDLLKLPNLRIIISTRSFDLEYDADLRKFGDNWHIRQIEVGTIAKSDVMLILKLLKIDANSDLLIELLTVPYNLELFTKIPNLDALIHKETSVTIAKLYSELWTQVLNHRHLKLVECLNAIVKRMYELHPNLIDQHYLEEYHSEIDFLVSNEILQKNENKLSFFHQSFYEYYLARWFVVSDKDLTRYIFDEGQSLYIRSLIKTVIEYLREADHSKYIDLYYKIIRDEKIRFHIKYLFILEFGLVEIPSNREKEFVVCMLGDGYGKLFLELFNSPGWLTFLITNSLFPENANEIYQILYRNAGHEPKLTLDYLENSDFAEKNKLFEGIIPNINKWDNRLLPFFEKYYPYNDSTELWYFDTLKKISVFNFNFVLDKLRIVIQTSRAKTERLKFDHRFDGIIDFLYQKNARAIAEFLFSIHLEILENTKHPYYDERSGVNSPLHSSYVYDNALFYKDSEDERSTEYYLLKYYRQCDKSEIKQIIDRYCDTNYVSLLILFTKILRDRAPEFLDEIYDLILTVQEKNGFLEVDDFFQLNMRKMIGKSIQFFTEDRYSQIKKILMTITHPYEVWIYEDRGKKKHELNVGRKKYLFLKAIPDDILRNDPDLLQSYRVLERRFGQIDHNKAFDRNKSRFGGVGSPLSNPNFAKFSYDAWLKSMRKIDENFRSDDFFKGGLLEHARSFEKAVEDRPEYFAEFISRLFVEPNISFSYISHGISALIKIKYDSDTVAELVSKEINLSLDKEHTLYAIWHVRSLISTGHITVDILNFLISIVRSDTYPNDVLNPHDPIIDFVNTPRGSALHNLLYLTDYPQYQEAIFDTVEYAISPKNNPSTTILAGVMSQVAYLNHLDTERAFRIFQQLVDLKIPLVLKFSIDPAQYYNNQFHKEMGFYFNEMLLQESLHDKCYFFVTSWIFERIDDYETYNQFMKLGEKAVKCALTVAEKLLLEDGKINDRAMQVLQRCLSHTEFDLSHEFSGLTLRKFKTENFLQLFEFIEKYIGTIHFSKDPRYLLNYLTEAASSYPVKCLRLLEKMNISGNVDISKKAYIGDEPLVLVLSIYSKLRLEPYKYKQEQQLALDAFDRLLEVPAIRYKALDAMNKVLN